MSLKEIKKKNLKDFFTYVKKEITLFAVMPTCMSKKRYAAMKEDLIKSKSQGVYDIDDILDIFCKHTQFDPEAKIYTQELGKQAMENRRKLADSKGWSIYRLRQEYKNKKSQMEKEKTI